METTSPDFKAADLRLEKSSRGIGALAITLQIGLWYWALCSVLHRFIYRSIHSHYGEYVSPLVHYARVLCTVAIVAQPFLTSLGVLWVLSFQDKHIPARVAFVIALGIFLHGGSFGEPSYILATNAGRPFLLRLSLIGWLIDGSGAYS